MTYCSKYLVSPLYLTVLLLLWQEATAQTVYRDSLKNRHTDTVLLQEVVVKTARRIYMDQQVDRMTIYIGSLPSNSSANMLDVLNSTPSILIEENGNISIKGRQNAWVYIDNKPLNLSGNELLNYLRSLPSGSIDKIEVFSNPPARYSAAGSGGIIHIRTKKSAGQGFNGSFLSNYSQGVYAKSNQTFSGNYKTKDINIYGFLSNAVQHNFYEVHRNRVYTYPNGINDYSIHQDIAETSTTKTVHYKLGIDYDLNTRTGLNLFFSGFASPYREKGNYNNAFLSPSIDSTVYSASNLRTTADYYALNLGFHHQLQKNQGEITVNIDYLDRKNESNQVLTSDTYLPNHSLATTQTLLSGNPFAAKIYSAGADYSVSVLPGIKLETGFQSTYSTRQNTGVYFNQNSNTISPIHSLNNTFLFNESIHAFYLTAKRDYKRITLQAGLRMESTLSDALQSGIPGKPDSSFAFRYTRFFPTAYLSYKVDSSSRHLWIFSFGQRITRPNYQDFNPSIFFFNRYTYSTGNSLLQPQLTFNFEASYNYNKKFVLGIQYNQTSHMILQAFRQVNEVFITTLSNLEHASNFGINTTNTIRINRYWSCNLYQELTANAYRGAFLTGDNHLNNSMISYQGNVYNQFSFLHGWTADLTGIYRSSVLYGQSIRRSVWQVHLGIQKKYGNRASFSVAIRDLFHSWVIKRDIYIPYAQVTVSNKNDTRFISFSFSYRLGKQVVGRRRHSSIQTEAERAGASN